MAKKKNETGRKVRKTKRVYEGDIRKVTEYVVESEPAEPLSPSAAPEPSLPKVPDNHVDDEVPEDVKWDFGPNACIASERDTFAWILYPCMKVTRSALHFNDAAIRTFGLKTGMALMPGSSEDKTLVTVIHGVGPFPNDTMFHRTGFFKLTVRNEADRARPDCARPHALYGTIRSGRKGGMPWVVRNPGFENMVFRLRQHPLYTDVLVGRAREAFNPDDKSDVGRLTARGSVVDFLCRPGILQRN